jgi:hypothetical protein
MSSIDEEALEALAGPLFDALTEGAPATRSPFPLRPDPGERSYYVSRGRTFMRRGDFSTASCLDAEELEHRLAAYWRAAGQPRLAARAALVARTAVALRSLYEQAEPKAEVSPYIYSMF